MVSVVCPIATVVIMMHHVKLNPHVSSFRLEPVAVVNDNVHVPEQHYTNHQGSVTYMWKFNADVP
jgi:hypothetical protein